MGETEELLYIMTVLHLSAGTQFMKYKYIIKTF